MSADTLPGGGYNQENNRYSALVEHYEEIAEDLARINLARITNPANNGYNFADQSDPQALQNSLRIVENPLFLLTTGEGYIIGDPLTSGHSNLYEIWLRVREEFGFYNLSTHLVSGVAFNLKTDPSTKYVRLDTDAIFLEEFPPFAEPLVKDGFLVVDGSMGKKISHDVDYSLFWTQRNDLI